LAILRPLSLTENIYGAAAFLLDRDVKIQATRSTALLAGAWTPLSFAFFGRWTPPEGLNAHVVTGIYLLACVFLWILPAVLFAYGFDLKRWDPDYMYQPHAPAEIGEMWVRGGFWLFSSIVCSLVLWLAA
jgi:hypothetical protein